MLECKYILSSDYTVKPFVVSWSDWLRGQYTRVCDRYFDVFVATTWKYFVTLKMSFKVSEGWYFDLDATAQSSAFRQEAVTFPYNSLLECATKRRTRVLSAKWRSCTLSQAMVSRKTQKLVMFFLDANNHAARASNTVINLKLASLFMISSSLGTGNGSNRVYRFK